MTQAKQPEYRLPLWRRAAYGLPDLGVGIFVTLKAVLLLPFMTELLGIPIHLAGLLVSCVLLLDICTDPLVGWVSDHTSSPWGRRVPFVVCGGVVMALGTLMIFAIPQGLEATAALPWVFGFFFLGTLGYTLIIIPHGALTAEMTSHPLERSSLTAWRMQAFSVGILIAGGVLPGLIAAMGGGRLGHFWGYAYMAPLIVGSAWLGMAAVVRYDKPRPQRQLKLFAQIRLVFANRPFVALMLVFSLQLLGFGFISASLVYFSIYLLHDNGQNLLSGIASSLTVFALMFTAVTLASMASQPLWTWLSARLGKLEAYQLGMLGFGLSAAGFYWLLPADNVTHITAAIFVVGLFYGCLLQLPWALMPDYIDASVSANGSLVGAYNAYWLLGQKVANALGPGLVALILGWFGWRESVSGPTDQPLQALEALAMLMTLVPAAIFLLSVPLLRLIGHPHR